MGCNIYNRSFLFDVNYEDAHIKLSLLKSQLPRFTVETSGIWFPIYIKSYMGAINNVNDILIEPNLEISKTFDPLNCIPLTDDTYGTLETDPTINCNYCDLSPKYATGLDPGKYPTLPYTTGWYLRDTEGNKRSTVDSYGTLYPTQYQGTCCNGACDTRMQKDDYLPKIPILNQNYINGISGYFDFKYLSKNAFPATTDQGIGIKEFIEFTGSNFRMNNFYKNPALIIDWRIRPTISEIPYDPITTTYRTADDHKKAYNKALHISKTCGNFFLTKLDRSAEYNPYYTLFSGLYVDTSGGGPEYTVGDKMPTIALGNDDGISYHNIYYNVSIDQANNIPSFKLASTSKYLCCLNQNGQLYYLSSNYRTKLALSVTNLSLDINSAINNSNDNTFIVGYEKKIGIIDIDNKSLKYVIDDAHSSDVSLLSVSEDGLLLLSGSSDDKKIKLWNAKSPGQNPSTYFKARTKPTAILVTKYDNKYIAIIATKDKQIYIWDIISRKLLWKTAVGVSSSLTPAQRDRVDSILDRYWDEYEAWVEDHDGSSFTDFMTAVHPPVPGRNFVLPDDVTDEDLQLISQYQSDLDGAEAPATVLHLNGNTLVCGYSSKLRILYMNTREWDETVVETDVGTQLAMKSIIYDGFLALALIGDSNVEIYHARYFTKIKQLDGKNDFCFLDRSDENIDNLLNFKLPKQDEYKVPYGFSKNTYDNIFIRNQKIGSHWLWNYDSAILCWCRYFDVDIEKDDKGYVIGYNTKIGDERPIPGVDIYISPGDVFFAKSAGPEPNPTTSDDLTSTGGIKLCPQGLKLIKNNNVTGIIPQASQFTYISENIYSHFLHTLQRINNADILDNRGDSEIDRFRLAAILSTAPEYDEITVDLLKRNLDWPNYEIDDFRMIKSLKHDMSTSNIGSVSKLNYIKTKEDLINTLANKYGYYLYVPPNSSASIELETSVTKNIESCLLDIDFDMCIDRPLSIYSNNPRCVPTIDCNSNTFDKRYIYNQSISFGGLVLSSNTDIGSRYKTVCSSGTITPSGSAKTAGLYLNKSLIKETVYSTGCYILKNNYPRIITENTTNSCTKCDEYSTYKLPNIHPYDICSQYSGIYSWCDFPYAFTANAEDDGDRPARTMLNGSIYLERAYPVSIFNSHIDKIAFHNQGGIFFNSTVYNFPTGTTVFVKDVTQLSNSLNPLNITFDTKNVGIKIYSMKLEKLRTTNPDSYGCRAFPINNACKCFGLNTVTEYPYNCNGKLIFSNNPILYTPGISTSNSPRILPYGGYSVKELDNILGDNKRIPNHPSPSLYPLASVNKKIDPINPYGCEQSVSIVLNNYTKTQWSASIPAYDTIHSDVWAEILENVDLFKSAIFSEEDYNTYDDVDPLNKPPVFIVSRPNPGYQRFATKVVINNKTLYDQQKTIIAEKDGYFNSTNITFDLINPFLKGLLGDEYFLYPSSGTLCDSSSIFNGRGDEISSIPIKFSRVPRKQILHFAISPPNSTGILKKGFFHPNSGLSFSNRRESPLIDNEISGLFIDYDRHYFANSLNNSIDPTYNQSGRILIGEIDDNIKYLINQVGTFDSHKKLKLFLQLGGEWYYYDNPNLFGFEANNSTYIGKPFVFEYVHDNDSTDTIGPWLPTPPKEPILFDFVRNYLSPTTAGSLFTFTEDKYPLNYHNYVIVGNQMDIAGVRAYFNIAEKEDILISSAEKISDLTDLEQSSISEEHPYVKLTNGDRYRYKGAPAGDNNPKVNPQNYILVDYNYLYTNFSDLHIDYIDHDSGGYVKNTKKLCDQDISIINADDIDKNYKCKIISKSIYCTYIDKNGNDVGSDFIGDKYLKIFTRIILDKKIKYSKAYIDFTNIVIDPDSKDGTSSITIWRELSNTLKKENDVFLSNPLYASKWTDMINYDQSVLNEVGTYHHSSGYLNTFYPETLYKNNFYKILVNNTDYINFNALIYPKFITDPDSALKNALYHSGYTYYTIHQKYNIGLLNNYYLTGKYFQDQNNYLPFMDINFLPISGSNDCIFDEKYIIQDPSLPNSDLILGKIAISGVYQNLKPSHKYDPYLSPTGEKRYFWIHLDDRNKLKSSLTINQLFYSNTLRIDDTPFELFSINSESQSNEEKCSSVFKAQNISNTQLARNNFFHFNHYDSDLQNTDIFTRVPIYCDTDKNSTCGTGSCGINTAGWTSFSGDYNIFIEKEKDIDSIPDKVSFLLTYDGGLYNTLNSNKDSFYTYIQRFEIDPDKTIFNTSLCDSQYIPRPSTFKTSIYNNEYQSLLSNSIVDDHSSVVNNTDKLANEMLFRLIYGEKQKINLERIDGSQNNISIIDLFKYSDPKIEAKDLYNNIPYDLDIYADTSDRQINGTISIDGILQIGKRVSVDIDNASVEMSIRNIGGKINIIGTIQGNNTSEDFETTIYSEQITTTGLVVSTQPVYSSSEDDRYVNIGRCKERDVSDIFMIGKITSAIVEDDSCTANADGTRDRVSVNFPFWKDIDNPGGVECPTNGFDYGARYGACIVGNRVHYQYHYPCAWTTSYYWEECTNRCVGQILTPTDNYGDQCSEIARDQANIGNNGWNRGVLDPAVCHGLGGYAEPNNDLSFGLGGCVESLAGGAFVHDVVGMSLNPAYAPTSCGACFPLDHTDWNGMPRYNNKGQGWPVLPTRTEDACECKDFEYGYCTSSDRIDGCQCSTLNYEYTNFDYSFEYCRHNITLHGYKRRLAGFDTPSIINTMSAPDCSAEGRYNIPDSSKSFEGTEECAFFKCTLYKPATYYIFHHITTTRYQPYDAGCVKNLCNITYDNNKLTLTLSNGFTKCINIKLRNDCPKISVTVPDNSFSVSDTIDSQCNKCGVEPNTVKMVDQHSPWDILTETRTCVLGYLIQGNPNRNGPKLNVGGTQVIGCETGGCVTCPKGLSCNGWTYESDGYGLCGANAPESFPWHVCISKLGGYQCGKGHIGAPIVVGCDIPIHFPVATSNGAANQVLVQEWRSSMDQIYQNIAACKDNSDNQFPLEDIVQGVVPGSCGSLSYSSLSYPTIQFRTTFGDPEVQQGSITVLVAYYTYQYRRPKTIQDILKGDSASECSVNRTDCLNDVIKLSSRYKTQDCASGPNCYNTNATKCDPNDICCQAERIEYD